MRMRLSLRHYVICSLFTGIHKLLLRVEEVLCLIQIRLVHGGLRANIKRSHSRVAETTSALILLLPVKIQIERLSVLHSPVRFLLLHQSLETSACPSGNATKIERTSSMGDAEVLA